MFDERTFLQAIASQPNEDAPRLMFADYLDERGDANGLARAEFIRVQCALPHQLASSVSERLREREKTLLEAHWRTWLRPICQALGEPLPDAADTHKRHTLQWLNAPTHAHMIVPTVAAREAAYFGGGQFRRGFFTHAVLNAKPYRGPLHIARLVERTPLDGLTLRHYPERELRATLDVVAPQQLRSLELHATDAGGLLAVVGLRAFRTLRELVLRSQSYNTDVAALLSMAEHLQNLRTLSLNTCGISENGLQSLLEQPWVAGLTRLEMIHCGLTDQHAHLLFQRWPAQVQYADFSGNYFTAHAWRALHTKCAELHMHTPTERPWPERFYWC